MAQQQPIDWDAVYWTQMPRIYNFFRYRVGDDALAEDLTAATFIKAWKARASYRSHEAALATWLFTIARHIAADHYRQRRVELALDALDAPSAERPVEDLVQRAGDFARLSALLERLPTRERELVALKYGADFTNRAIADLTGLTESNVGTILHRVVARLRAEWEEVETR